MNSNTEKQLFSHVSTSFEGNTFLELNKSKPPLIDKKESDKIINQLKDNESYLQLG